MLVFPRIQLQIDSNNTSHQCCGSECGSGSTGSTSFLGLPDPDPLVRGIDPDPDPALDPNPDPSIIMQK